MEMYCKVLILKSYQSNVPCCVELSHVRVHTSKYLTSSQLKPPFRNVEEDLDITRCLYLFNRSLTLPLNMEPFMAWQQCRGPRCPHCDCIVHGLQDGVTIYFLLSLGHVILRCSLLLRRNYHRMLMQRFHGLFSLCTYRSFILAMRHGT